MSIQLIDKVKFGRRDWFGLKGRLPVSKGGKSKYERVGRGRAVQLEMPS